MASSIDAGQRLAAAVRHQLVALGEARVRSGPGRRTDGPAATPRGLSAALAQQVEALPADDPDRPRKAVRLFLAAELAREFGRGVLNDPAFPSLLDAVQQQMQEDAQTAAAVDALGRLLVAGRIAAP